MRLRRYQRVHTGTIRATALSLPLTSGICQTKRSYVQNGQTFIWDLASLQLTPHYHHTSRPLATLPTRATLAACTSTVIIVIVYIQTVVPIETSLRFGAMRLSFVIRYSNHLSPHRPPHPPPSYNYPRIARGMTQVSRLLSARLHRLFHLDSCSLSPPCISAQGRNRSHVTMGTACYQYSRATAEIQLSNPVKIRQSVKIRHPSKTAYSVHTTYSRRSARLLDPVQTVDLGLADSTHWYNTGYSVVGTYCTPLSVPIVCGFSRYISYSAARKFRVAFSTSRGTVGSPYFVTTLQSQ